MFFVNLANIKVNEFRENSLLINIDHRVGNNWDLNYLITC